MTVVFALMLAGTAAAEPRIAIGIPNHPSSIEHVSLALTPFRDYTRAVLTLGFSTTMPDYLDVTTSIDVPAGTRLIGMVVDTGADNSADAVLQGVKAAVASFEGGKPLSKALVLHAPVERHPDRYAVRVFPLTRGYSTHVAIELELPAVSSVELATTRAIPEVAIELDGAARDPVAVASRLSVQIPASTRTAPRAKARVDGAYALLGGVPLPVLTIRQPTVKSTYQETVEVTLPTPAEVRDANEDSDLSMYELRKAANASAPALHRCFRGERASTDHVDIHFAVLPTGRVLAISVEGLSENAKTCLVDVVAQWTFKQRDEAATATYPLRLRPIP